MPFTSNRHSHTPALERNSYGSTSIHQRSEPDEVVRDHCSRKKLAVDRCGCSCSSRLGFNMNTFLFPVSSSPVMSIECLSPLIRSQIQSTKEHSPDQTQVSNFRCFLISSLFTTHDSLSLTFLNKFVGHRALLLLLSSNFNQLLLFAFIFSSTDDKYVRVSRRCCIHLKILVFFCICASIFEYNLNSYWMVAVTTDGPLPPACLH